MVNIQPQANNLVSSSLRVVNNSELGTVVPGEFVGFDLAVANTTRVNVPGIRLLDVLPAGFRFKKGSVRLNGISAPDPVLSSDGKVLTFAVGDLAPESSSTISFMVEVTTGSRPGRVANVAAAINSDGVKSETVKEIISVIDDLQTVKAAVNITSADLQETPRSSAADEPGSSRLRLSRNVGRGTVAPGELISYDLTVVNTTQEIVPGVRLLDILPVGFSVKKGSVRLNGISAPAPTLSTDGKVLTFTVGDLAPEASLTFSFMVGVTAGSIPGKVVDVAAAISSDGWKSDTAKEIITVRDERPAKIAESIAPVIPLPVSPLLLSVPVVPVFGDVAIASPVVVAADLTTASSPLLSPLSAASAAPATDTDTIAPQVAVPPGQTFAPTPESSPQTVPKIAPAPVDEKPQAVVVQTAEPKPKSAQPTEPLVNTIASQVNDPGTSRLRLSRIIGHGTVAPGEIVSYELTVANTSRETLPGIRLLDMLPVGFSLKKGSVRINGISAPDPAFSTDGKVLTFAVGDLAPASSSTISFMVEVTIGSTPGKVVDVAAAISSDGVKSDTAKEIVIVRDELQPAKIATNITPVVPQETPQSSTEKASGAAAPVADDTTASLAAATTDKAAAPSPDSASQPSPPEAADDEEKPQADEPMPVELVVQKTQSLAELIGMAEISVLSDVDGQFVKNMAENQTLENEYANQVDETTLFESIRVGRSFNRESRAASARTEQANAQTGQAFALLLPSVSVRANYGSETSDPSVLSDAAGNPVSDTHSRTDATLSVRQPLFDLPSFLDWQRRKIVEKARSENYRVSDGDAYIAAVNAYLTIVSSRLQTDMTREFETKLNDLLIYVEKRAKAGAASQSDMARVRARSQATRSSRLEQESAHAAAGIEFIRLTNLVPRKVRLPALDDIGASLLPNLPNSAVKTAMKSNPEVAALIADIEAAEIDKLVAKGRYLPRVEAEYTNSYSQHAGGNPNSAGQKDQRLMMVMNWSLFSGGSDYKTHVERTARYKELQYRLDDQRRRVVQSLSANYATLATTRERITSGYQELNSISTAAEAMSKRMLSGNQSLLDMLDVYDRLYQVRSRLVTLHILEMSTAAQLVRLMQGTPGAISEVKATLK